MSNQAWVEPFISAGEDGTALANTTTPTSVLNAARKFTLNSNHFDFIGKTLRLRASGRISTTGTPTIQFTVKFGSTTVVDCGAVTTGSGITNLTWVLDVEIVCRAVGTSATVMGTGELKGVNTAIACSMLPASAPAAGTAFDATAAQQVDLFATWSAASASNTITCHQFSLLSLN